MRKDAERLVEAYSDMVVRLAYTYLQSRQDALDVCQDVLLKLLLREEPFDSGEHERAWVVRVTINMCKSQLTSPRRTRTAPLGADVEASEATVSPEETMDVLRAVGELPLTQREAVHLHYYEGYKISEIARMCNRSYVAVAKDLSRARKKLRALLEG